MGLCGSELALRVPKSGISGTKKAYFEQPMGFVWFRIDFMVAEMWIFGHKKGFIIATHGFVWPRIGFMVAQMWAFWQ